MSQEDKELKSTIAVGTANNSPMGPNGKASAAAPKLSDDDHVEMEEILASGSAVNPDEDIMQLARLGDIQAIEKLFDSGKFDASYADAEGITPLHVCVRI
jgi:palmitoyltransferase